MVSFSNNRYYVIISNFFIYMLLIVQCYIFFYFFFIGWQTGVSYKFSARDTSEFPFIKLLLGFFIFYAEFDYRSKIICPLLGKTIERKIFTDLTLLPNDMAPYVQYLKNTKNPKLFCLSPMCVQDPFNLSDNLTVMVKKSTLNNFRIFCSKSAEILTDSS